jgi:hypothetical protein
VNFACRGKFLNCHRRNSPNKVCLAGRLCWCWATGWFLFAAVMMSLTPSAQKTLVEQYSSIEPTMAELKQAILILAARHDDHDRRLKSLEESCADSHRGTAAAVRSIVEMREREQALLARLDHNDQAIAAVLAEHARKVDMPGLEALLALKADKKSADQRLRDAARQLAELREQVFARCESLQQAMQQAMQEMQLLDSRLVSVRRWPADAPAAAPSSAEPWRSDAPADAPPPTEQSSPQLQPQPPSQPPPQPQQPRGCGESRQWVDTHASVAVSPPGSSFGSGRPVGRTCGGGSAGTYNRPHSAAARCGATIAGGAAQSVPWPGTTIAGHEAHVHGVTHPALPPQTGGARTCCSRPQSAQLSARSATSGRSQIQSQIQPQIHPHAYSTAPPVSIVPTKNNPYMVGLGGNPYMVEGSISVTTLGGGAGVALRPTSAALRPTAHGFTPAGAGIGGHRHAPTCFAQNGAHDGPSLAPTVTSAAMGFGGEHEEVRVNAAEVAAAQRRLEEHLEARS